MKGIARQMRFFFPRPNKALIVTLFADKNLRRICDPVRDGCAIASEAKVAGVLIDTFAKRRGHTLLDLMDLDEITAFVRSCHEARVEAWIAGSIKRHQLPSLWQTGVDVICVRGAACEGGEGRLGTVSRERVRELVESVPAFSRKATRRP